MVQASILLKNVKANKISSLLFFVDQHSRCSKPQRTASPRSSSFISCSPNPPSRCETPPSVVQPSSEAENGRGGLGRGLRHSPWKSHKSAHVPERPRLPPLTVWLEVWLSARAGLGGTLLVCRPQQLFMTQQSWGQGLGVCIEVKPLHLHVWEYF